MPKTSRSDVQKVKIQNKRVKKKNQVSESRLELEGGEDETTMSERLSAKLGKSDNPNFFHFNFLLVIHVFL